MPLEILAGVLSVVDLAAVVVMLLIALAAIAGVDHEPPSSRRLPRDR
ncbi:hypothetical protein [Nocardia pseudobrasiliensis]|uniref:Uncharacterized protein n=1 Tax=Nocardia pseudobrasiliensis TaxID=45979 RepID=A0A370IG00_9NOCA|nr:hypothetical protein [Nocardia pseudobrasiliensis]RDI68384.1 hypothetical protein DFR76_102785 [Nocardia pseudobrasiliensis]